MLYGARISLVVGVVASTVGTLVGAILGLMSGYWGGRTDAIIQRFIDILMSFPLIILALTLLTALQRSLATVIVAIGVPFIPYGARGAGQCSGHQGNSICGSGAGHWLQRSPHHCAAYRAKLRLSTSSSPQASLVAIITESALGFLGLSIPPPTPTLGGMLSEALALLMFAPRSRCSRGVHHAGSVRVQCPGRCFARHTRSTSGRG